MKACFCFSNSDNAPSAKCIFWDNLSKKEIITSFSWVLGWGTIIFLIAASSIMSWVLAFTNIPTIITEFILGISSSKVLVLLAMNILLLVVGTFMDLTPAILIFTPIFLPIAQNLGMDTIQFGIMLVFNLCIGTITPPVGNTLFVGCRVAKTKIEGVIKNILPFYVSIFVVLMLVTFIPAISLFLPRVMGMLE